MVMSKAHIKASAKYNAKAYEQIIIRVKKGEKATLQAIATNQGMSLNSFITTAIEQYLSSIQESAGDEAQKDSELKRADQNP